jgi:hypothetical protein
LPKISLDGVFLRATLSALTLSKFKRLRLERNGPALGRRVLAYDAVVLAVIAVFSIAPVGASTGQHFASAHRHAAVPATFVGPNGPEARLVVNENKKPGTTNWEITGTQSPTGIMGYDNLVQAKKGSRVTLYVSTAAPSFRVEAFRMGYYRGKGARLIWQSESMTGVQQPVCPITPQRQHGAVCLGGIRQLDRDVTMGPGRVSPQAGWQWRPAELRATDRLRAEQPGRLRDCGPSTD